MRSRLLPLCAFVLVGAGIVAAAVTGASRAASRAGAAAGPTDEERAPRFFTAAGAFGHGDPARRGIDPYAPPGLPPGVTIDRESGRMVGLAAVAPAGATWLSWEHLGRGRPEDGPEGVPGDLRALAGKVVALAGFLKAIYEFEHIRTFLLVGSHLACCFGTFPGPGGVVEVTLAEGEGDAARTVRPILVVGRLALTPIYDTYRGRRRVALLYRVTDARLRPLGP